MHVRRVPRALRTRRNSAYTALPPHVCVQLRYHAPAARFQNVLISHATLTLPARPLLSVHSTCVDPWLEGNRCCPNCRFDIATESTRALGELRGGDGAAGASALGGAVSGVTSAGGINAAGGGAGGGAAGGGNPPPRQILGGISASSYSTPPPSAAGGISAANYSAPPPGAVGGSIPGAFR